MNKLNTSDLVKQAINVGFTKLKELNVDLKEDNFTIVQPVDDGQGIVISITDDESRSLKVDVTDSLVVLPFVSGHLDIYVEEVTE